MDKIGSIEIRITGFQGSLELTPEHYNPGYDEGYLKSLRDKAKKSWNNVKDPDTWLSEMRGSYDL